MAGRNGTGRKLRVRIADSGPQGGAFCGGRRGGRNSRKAACPHPGFIEGRSALARNTIHILFGPEDGGETKRRIVEFAGTDRYEKQTLRIEPLKGSGKLSLVFLPGSRFDLKGFQFHRDSGSENM